MPSLYRYVLAKSWSECCGMCWFHLSGQGRVQSEQEMPLEVKNWWTCSDFTRSDRAAAQLSCGNPVLEPGTCNRRRAVPWNCAHPQQPPVHRLELMSRNCSIDHIYFRYIFQNFFRTQKSNIFLQISELGGGVLLCRKRKRALYCFKLSFEGLVSLRSVSGIWPFFQQCFLFHSFMLCMRVEIFHPRKSKVLFLVLLLRLSDKQNNRHGMFCVGTEA